jgi:ribosome-associated toxin RatA of RatAB toxin-antitoxin module
MFAWLSGNSSSTSSPAEATEVITSGVRDKLIVEKSNFAHCFGVVSQVQKYPEFLSVYKSVEVLSVSAMPHGIERVARYTIEVPSLVKPFLSELVYTLKLTLEMDNTNKVAIMRWTHVDGPSFLKENNGKWIVRQKGDDVELELEIDMSYSFYLPSYISNMIQTSMLKDSLGAIKKRAVETQKK